MTAMEKQMATRKVEENNPLEDYFVIKAKMALIFYVGNICNYAYIEK